MNVYLPTAMFSQIPDLVWPAAPKSASAGFVAVGVVFVPSFIQRLFVHIVLNERISEELGSSQLFVF